MSNAMRFAFGAEILLFRCTLTVANVADMVVFLPSNASLSPPMVALALCVSDFKGRVQEAILTQLELLQKQ